jgi:hypothetical protein
MSNSTKIEMQNAKLQVIEHIKHEIEKYKKLYEEKPEKDDLDIEIDSLSKELNYWMKKYENKLT